MDEPWEIGMPVPDGGRVLPEGHPAGGTPLLWGQAPVMGVCVLLGAVCGLDFVMRTGGPDAALAGALCGAGIGAVLGLASSLALRGLVHLLERMNQPRPPPPPPPWEVLWLGAALGRAEGALVGLAGGQLVGAFAGGFIGFGYGRFFALLSWAVRRRMPLLVLSLLLGGLTEAAGCLVIASFVRWLTLIPLVTLLFALQGGVLVAWRCLSRLLGGAGR